MRRSSHDEDADVVATIGGGALSVLDLERADVENAVIRTRLTGCDGYS
jgi:hypothetical protein